MLGKNQGSIKSQRFLSGLRTRIRSFRQEAQNSPTQTVTGIALLVVLFGLMGTYFWGSYRGEKKDASIETNVLSCHDDILGIHRGTGGQAWVAGKNGLILHTNDGGRSWRQQVSGTTVTLTGISFADGNVGFVVGSSGTILVTQDGGLSWRKQASGIKQNLLGVQALDKTKAYAIGAFGTFLSTSDGGTTWTKYNLSWEKLIQRVIEETGGLVEPNLNALHFITPAIGWVVGEFGLVVHTKDGGQTWTSQRNSGKLGQLFGVMFRDERVGWSVGQRGSFIWTKDGGQHWFSVEHKIDRDLFGVSLEGQNALVVGDRTFLTSKDGGATWTEDKSVAENVMLTGVACMNGSSPYAILVGQAGVMLTKDKKKVEKCIFPRY